MSAESLGSLRAFHMSVLNFQALTDLRVLTLHPGSLQTLTRLLPPSLAHDVSKRLVAISYSRSPPQPRPRTLCTSAFKTTSSRRPPIQPLHFPFVPLRGLVRAGGTTRQDVTILTPHAPGCSLRCWLRVLGCKRPE